MKQQDGLDFDSLCKYTGKMYFEFCIENEKVMRNMFNTIQEFKQKLAEKDKIIEELSKNIKGG